MNSQVSRTKSRKLAQGRSDHIGRDLIPLADLLHAGVFAELARRGFDDVRFGHQAVFINIDDEGSTLTELATRAKVSKQAMHELVNDLEARGYVERIPSPLDGRSKLIRTTDKGERSIEAAWRAIEQIEREWTAILGSTGLEKLRSYLRKINEHYSETADETSPPRDRAFRR
jgi:DNA-binding MarR family transcriptional regulator